MAAISRNLTSGQNRMINDGTISPLVRLLRLPRTSRKVTIAVLHAIKCLCIGKFLVINFYIIETNENLTVRYFYNYY